MSRVGALQFSHQPRPDQIVAKSFLKRGSSLLVHPMAHFRALFMEMRFPANRLRQYLRLAGILQQIHAQEGDGTVFAHGKRSMVAQDQQALLAEIIDQAFPLIKVQCDAFIIMIGQIIMDLQRKLRVAP